MTKIHVASTSTVFEPRTSATATTASARFLDDAAFGAYGTGNRRSEGWHLCMGIEQDSKEEIIISQ